MLTQNQKELLVGFKTSDVFPLHLTDIKIELTKRLNVELNKFDTQLDAAKFIGTTQSRISFLNNYQVDGITVDKILEYLSKFEIILSIKFHDGKLFISNE